MKNFTARKDEYKVGHGREIFCNELFPSGPAASDFKFRRTGSETLFLKRRQLKKKKSVPSSTRKRMRKKKATKDRFVSVSAFVFGYHDFVNWGEKIWRYLSIRDTGGELFFFINVFQTLWIYFH